MIKKTINRIHARQAMLRHIKVKMAEENVRTSVEAVADAVFMIAGVLEDNTTDFCDICEYLKQQPGGNST